MRRRTRSRKSGSVAALGAAVWDAADGTVLATADDRRNAIFETEFAPVGDLVVTTTSGSPAYVWHGRDGSRAATLEPPQRASDATFSRSGRLLALTSDRRTYVYDTEDWTLVNSLRGSFADFSRDDRFVITRTGDGLQVWTTREGEPVLELTPPTLLEHAAFAPDARSIVAIGVDGLVRAFPCPTCADVDELLAAAERRLAPRR